jgi:hypothetical protein
MEDREVKWSADVTLRDIARKVGVNRPALEPFYADILRICHEDPHHFDITEGDKNASVHEVMVDYLYECYGRPKWFIDSNVMELLCSLKLEEDDLTGIFFPHDVFSLVFEQGTMLNGWPLRNIRVCRPLAKSTYEFTKAIGLTVYAELPKNRYDRIPLTLFTDTGEDSKTGVRSWATPHESMVKLHWTRPLDDRAGESLRVQTSLTKEEVDFQCKVSALMASALLYRSARPESVVNYQLPRSCRYNYRGDKSTYRRILAPTSVYSAKTGASGGTGSPKAGHYRGWVFRTLRHERYKRNDDGTFKTVLVEPTAIKGGPERS